MSWESEPSDEGFSFARDVELEELGRLFDVALLDRAIAQGVRINQVTDHFKCYDAALKIKRHGWTPTMKQRQAIQNVLAHWLASRG
jgi:hypothetical protein